MKNLKPRAQRRLIKREGSKVEQELIKVIRAFEKALFAETPSHITYLTIFNKFNNQWKSVCDKLKGTLKVVVPDQDFFHNNFKPQVN